MSRDARREAASGRPNEHDDDLTWLDYLRTAGGSVRDTRPGPPDRRESRDSTDRKRRHTGSEPERRNYPYPTYMRGPSDTSSGIHNPPRGGVLQSGSSRDTPIDLTSPPRPVRPSYSRMQSSDDSRGSGSSSGRYGRRESDIVLPRWQPDNEVTKCPVCETEFSLLYRRHHCRKCGRVVCNRCSPHRITIPRQYIVQPPNPYLLEDEAQAASPPGRVNPALGGGDTVRVCNPCVPDPWMPHTNNAASAPIAPVPPIPNMPTNNNIPPFGPFGPDPRMMALPPNQRPIGGSATPSSDPVARSRSNTHQPTGTSNAAQLERLLAQTRSIPPISTRYHGHRYSQSSGAGPVNYFNGHGHPRPALTPDDRSRDTVPTNSFGLSFHRADPSRDPRLQNQAAMAPPVLPQSRPRRQVREEDECPVCGEELPPGDEIREAHVQECILTRFSSSPTRPAAAIPALPDLADSTPEGSRPRTNSFRPRGMYKSKATEKDCLGADGEPQECIICFEEFEPGDELGTMECWCKFHRDCIRGWWEKKGAGSCPTHRLYD